MDVREKKIPARESERSAWDNNLYRAYIRLPQPAALQMSLIWGVGDNLLACQTYYTVVAFLETLRSANQCQVQKIPG